MGKIITFYNKKGGVGKTSLSYNLARDLDFYLLSNDDSVIEDTYQGKAKVMEEIQLIEGENIVYDLGGFVDKNNEDIFRASDLIIVPTIADLSSLKRTFNTVNELKEFNKNILVVGNMVRDNKDKEFIEAYCKEAQFFVRYSKAFHRSFLEETTISEICNESKLSSHVYRNVYKEYSDLLNFIKNTYLD